MVTHDVFLGRRQQSRFRSYREQQPVYLRAIHNDSDIPDMHPLSKPICRCGNRNFQYLENAIDQ